MSWQCQKKKKLGYFKIYLMPWPSVQHCLFWLLSGLDINMGKVITAEIITIKGSSYGRQDPSCIVCAGKNAGKIDLGLS